MRDSYGSTLLISIMMIFVVLIVSFTAVIVNFAKTFRVKNQLIDYIEQYQYAGPGSVTEDATLSAIDSYLSNVGYNMSLDKGSRCSSGTWHNGICIESSGSDNNQYYKVTVYVTVSVPFLVDSFTLPVSGESRASVNLS